MKNFLKGLLCAVAILSGWSVKAQTNLILNPSFEEEHIWKASTPSQYVANHWGTSAQIEPSIIPNGRTGKALQIIPNRITAFISSSKSTIVEGNIVAEPTYITVTPGSEYRLKFYYKIEEGATKRPSLGVRFTWANTSGEEISIPSSNGAALGTKSLSSKTDWKEEIFNFTAPQNPNISRLGLQLRITGTDGDKIWFDDFSLIETKPALPPAPTAPAIPSELKATQAHQRELELSWKAVPNASYELVVGSNSPIALTTNSYTLEGLEPGKSYTIKVRSKANNIYSDYSSPQTIRTTSMTKAETDKERIPHLRTIDENGSCPQVLGLYYTDLFGANPTISYKVNGKSITPNGNKLQFPEKGRQTLTIEIIETPERAWILEYNVNVQ